MDEKTKNNLMTWLPPITAGVVVLISSFAWEPLGGIGAALAGGFGAFAGQILAKFLSVRSDAGRN